MGDDDGWDNEKDLVVVKGNWDDEDEEVKDEWDAEEEEKPVQQPKVVPARPKVRPVVATEMMTESPIVESEQEKKARLERLVREKDLEGAMSLFGISGPPPTKEASIPSSKAIPLTFDTFTPTTIPEFDQFTRIITKRFESLENSKHYPQFLEGLVKALMSKREVPEIRKVAGIISDMATLKLKQASSKQAAPTLKGVVKKGSSRYDDFDDYADGDGFDE